MTDINKILELARSQLGVKEAPAGSNRVKYNTAYYGREVSGGAYPWCCAFIWWLFREAGAPELCSMGEARPPPVPHCITGTGVRGRRLRRQRSAPATWCFSISTAIPP